MELPMLYRQASTGKTQQWKVWTEDNVIFTEYGVKDGKLQTTSKAVQGKNIGRANETTPKKQAEFEAKSMWQKRIDGKYSKTLKESEQTVFLPMLTHDMRKQKSPLVYPVLVQPKLNGVRCMAFWEGDKVKLLSRGGKEYDVAHITKELEKTLPKNLVLDGELYVHGMQLQDIVALVKKHREGPTGSILLQYQVYDGFKLGKTETPCWDRLDLLDEWFEENNHSYIRLVTTSPASKEETINTYLYEYEQDGFEGAIIRLPKGVYKLGHRSRDLLKLKNFQDAEFEIVGFSHGSGRDENAVVWTCKTKDGKEFNARPKGTREQREEWLANGNKYIGKMLTVKFQALTNDGIPQFPVGIAVRDYE